jgi:PAS domain S-box-containing protein
MLSAMQGPLPVQSDVRLRLALDAAELGTWYWDAPSGITVWDRQMRRIFGVGAEWPGTYEAWIQALHPLDRADVVAALDEAVAAGERYEVRHRILREDGRVRWIEGIGQVVRDAGGTVTGTIGCARDITARVERDEQLARSLATQAALADQARRAAARMEQLQELTASLAAALTVDDVAELLGRRLPDAVGASRTGLVLRTPDGRGLRLVSGQGCPDHVAQALGVRGLEEDLNGTAAILPLQVADDVLGALTLGFAEEQPFDAEQRNFLLAIAAQAAQAVARSLLVTQLREVSRELQAGLAPGDVPSVDGLEVAADYQAGGEAVEAIGGDWFDVVPLADGSAAIVVGDVMGRGVRAAATMTRLRASVRAFLSETGDPATVVAKLDRLVVREDLHDFVTLLVARLDPVSGALTAVNAGHVQPVLVEPRADAGTVLARVLPVPPGPPVGLADEPRSGVRGQLMGGATLLLFTDGLVERVGEDIDSGVDLVVEIAGRGHDRLPDLVSDVVATLRRPPCSDDVTVLAVRRSRVRASTPDRTREPDTPRLRWP